MVPTNDSFINSGSIVFRVIFEIIQRILRKWLKLDLKKINSLKILVFQQPESDGSRSGSSLSLRNLTGPDAIQAGTNSQVQSPTHRRVHRSISATSTNPSRRASSGGETLRKFTKFAWQLGHIISNSPNRCGAGCSGDNHCEWHHAWNSNSHALVNSSNRKIVNVSPQAGSWRQTANQAFLSEAVTLKDKTRLMPQRLKRTQLAWPRIKGHSRHSQKPQLSLVRSSL